MLFWGIFVKYVRLDNSGQILDPDLGFLEKGIQIYNWGILEMILPHIFC